MLTVHRELLNMLSLPPVKSNSRVRTNAADIAALMDSGDDEDQPVPIPSTIRRQLKRRSASMQEGIINAAEMQMLQARERLHVAFSRYAPSASVCMVCARALVRLGAGCVCLCVRGDGQEVVCATASVVGSDPPVVECAICGEISPHCGRQCR